MYRYILYQYARAAPPHSDGGGRVYGEGAFSRSDAYLTDVSGEGGHARVYFGVEVIVGIVVEFVFVADHDLLWRFLNRYFLHILPEREVGRCETIEQSMNADVMMMMILTLMLL